MPISKNLFCVPKQNERQYNDRLDTCLNMYMGEVGVEPTQPFKVKGF
ncbi:hypothetical protein KsCSTR_15020 [Candidatus Kuenenia stuttgartiensis]|uniref:Uncharacterized protein n=1 Tax=Kuenenia stuttgartiensis TaxID=174633 RepID=A0A6G7GN65_KUEST|nr:hypothetical protein KsCSTR_15020 [Candidatus Kuenenia stuttgartiensis]